MTFSRGMPSLRNIAAVEHRRRMKIGDRLLTVLGGCPPFLAWTNAKQRSHERVGVGFVLREHG